MKSIFACLAVFILAPASAHADVRLSNVLSDNMVLQRDIPVPVWGQADPGERITVGIGEAQATAEADAQGRWMAKLPAMRANATSQDLTVRGKNTLVTKNVLVGDVWICSGQSNMALPLRRCVGRDVHDSNGLGQANHSQIRLFAMRKFGTLEPRAESEGKWSECTPDAAREFSAVGYFFGVEIHKAEGVPVGLIGANRGSTNAEFWTSLEGLQSEPALRDYVHQAIAAKTDYPARKAQYDREVEKSKQDAAQWQQASKAWVVEAAKARKEGKPEPARPTQPGTKPARPAGMDTYDDNFMAVPTVLFNAMIHPLAPFGIKGVIWYQGEGNSDKAMLYRTLFPAMIRDWRTHWGQGDFPFYYVQLANYMACKDQPGESDWAALREAQLMTLKTSPNTGMAVAIDIGEANNIHPTNKREVGRRLALAARAMAYGREIEYSGPLYDRMEIKDGTIVVHFTHVGAGLDAKGGGTLKQFAIAGEDRKFVWAEARIIAHTVVVSSAKVPKPMAVRYAWADNPEGCNLVNKDGLPASPFRTDTW